MAQLNIGYEALVSCHEKLVSEIAQDPKQMAVSLFQHRFIFEDTKAKINELDRTKRDKAILLVDNIESKVKCYPEFYEKFLLILGKNELLYCDLVKSLREEYEKIEAESKYGYESYPLSLLQPLPGFVMAEGTGTGFPELPSRDDDDGNKLIRAAATSRQGAPTCMMYSISAIDDPGNDIDEGGPDHNTDASYSDPHLHSINREFNIQVNVKIRSQTKPQQKREITKPKEKLAHKNKCYNCFLSLFVGFLFLFVLGFLGSLLYDGYSLVGTTNVAQIHRKSVPLIGILDNPSTFDSLRFSVPTNRTDFVPISFYTLRNCSSSAAFIDVDINEIVTASFDSLTEKSKAVTELYLASNTTLTVDITTEVLSNYSVGHCNAFLLVFDDFNNFLNFISSSSLVENFYYKGCIENNKSQAMIMTFYKPSYYYIGVYTDIPIEATTFSLHFLGTYLQYNISNKNAGCSIDSRDDLSCEIKLYPNTNQQTCIVGSIPPSATLLGIKVTAVDFYAAVNSDTSINFYFYLPLIFLTIVICIVFFVYCYPKFRLLH